MSADPRPSYLSPSTYVPLTVIGCAVAITIVIMAKLNAIENSIRDLQEATKDRWTASNMDSWVDKARYRNPALVLPTVEEVKRPLR